jgi:hypothetical protein
MLSTRALIFHLFCAFLLANALFFLDEGLHSFNYWTQPGEVLILFLLTIIIAVPPIVIHYKLKGKSTRFAALGYFPWIMLVLVLL